MIIAKARGELTATHMVVDQIRLEDANNAATRIARILQSEGPPINLLNQTISSIIRICSGSFNFILPNDSDAHMYIAGLNAQMQISQQTYDFHVAFAHAIPPSFFANRESQNTWSSLCNVMIHYTPLAEFDATLGPNIPELWVRLPALQLFAIYDAIGRSNIEHAKNFYAGSALVYIASLCKETNVTPGWLSRRKDMLAKVLQGFTNRPLKEEQNLHMEGSRRYSF